MASGMVSIRDIASAGEVSPGTVSRILGGESHLYKPETVNKIMELAKNLGYRRNLQARGVFKGKTQTIGVMVRFELDLFFASMLRGIHDALVDADYAPLLALPTEHVSVEDEIHRLVDRRVDGIILNPSSSFADPYQELFDLNIPVVVVDDETAPLRSLDFVGTDDVFGGRLAAKHLLGLGHQRMAHLTHSYECKQIVDSPLGMRYQGFLDELKNCPDIVCEFVDDANSHALGSQGPLGSMGYSSALELLRRADRPTAIFASMDHLARGIYQAAAELGLRIPEDLSVVGFGDLEFAGYMTPPLTTVRQSPYEIGTRAVQVLLQRIEERETPRRETHKIRMIPELVVRQSTAWHAALKAG